ncbi:hypothetical protein GGS21DRAFT_452973 [Xylaria nigripes]|nr:hypothetical protein GGS21DRAFT_452973 [Xylaria nigripes]
MQPSMRLRTSAKSPSVPLPLKSSPGLAKKNFLPALAWVAATCVVGLYIRRQLLSESGTFDQIYSQKNTPEVEESRKKAFLVDTHGDPRNSMLNVLGWTK